MPGEGINSVNVNVNITSLQIAAFIALAGTDEKAIINLLTKRTNYQRQIITDSYQGLYSKVNTIPRYTGVHQGYTVAPRCGALCLSQQTTMPMSINTAFESEHLKL